MIQRQLPGLVENSISIERMARYLEDTWSRGALLRTADHDVLVGLIEEFRLGARATSAERIVGLLSGSVGVGPLKSDFEVNVVTSLLDEAYRIESALFLLGGSLSLPTPLAVEWAKDKALELAKYLSEVQRETIKKLIVSALGKTPMNGRELAPLIISCVDLTPTQSGWVFARYRRLIGQGYTPERAQLDVDAFALKLRKQRALTISVTEINRALIGGRMMAWEEYKAKGYLKDVMKRWLTAPDCCPLCLPLNGQTVPVSGLFDTPWGMISDTSNGHPRCRCNIVMAGVYDIEVGAGLKAGPLVLPGAIPGYVEPPVLVKALVKAAISKALLSKEREGHPFRGNQHTGGIPGTGGGTVRPRGRGTPRSGLVGAQAAVGVEAGVTAGEGWSPQLDSEYVKQQDALRKLTIKSSIESVKFFSKFPVLNTLSPRNSIRYGDSRKPRADENTVKHLIQYLSDYRITSTYTFDSISALDDAAPFVKFKNAAQAAERMLSSSPEIGKIAQQWLAQYVTPSLIFAAGEYLDGAPSRTDFELLLTSDSGIKYTAEHRADKGVAAMDLREYTLHQISGDDEVASQEHINFSKPTERMNTLTERYSKYTIDSVYAALGATSEEERSIVALYLFADASQTAWAKGTNSVASLILKKSIGTSEGHDPVASLTDNRALAEELYTARITSDGMAPLSVLADSYVESVYSLTQEELASEGITSLPVWRGIQLRPETPAWRITEEQAREKDAQVRNFTSSLEWSPAPVQVGDHIFSDPRGFLAGSGVMSVAADSISSWCTEEKVATDFSTMGDINTQYAAVLSAQVPASSIFSFAHTGLGSLSEHEVVLVDTSKREVAVTAKSVPKFVPERLGGSGIEKSVDGFVFYIDFPGLDGADWIKRFKDSPLSKEEDGHAFRGNQYTGGIPGLQRAGIAGRSMAAPPTVRSRPRRIEVEDLLVRKPKESFEIIRLHGFKTLEEFGGYQPDFQGLYGLSHWESTRNAEKDLRPLLAATRKEIDAKFEETRILAISEFSKQWNPDPKTRKTHNTTPRAQNVPGLGMGGTLLMDHAEVLITKTVEAMKPYYGSITYNPVEIVGIISRPGLRGSMGSRTFDGSQNTLKFNLLPQDSLTSSVATAYIRGSISDLIQRGDFSPVGTDTNSEGLSQNLESAAPIFFAEPFYDAHIVFTLLHELGHNLDSVAYEPEFAIPDSNGGVFEWPESFGYYEQFAKAKESGVHTSESPEVAALEGVLPEMTALLKAARGSKWFRERSKTITDPELGMKVGGVDDKKELSLQREYRTYWRSPVEVFARIYAQWVATKLLAKDSQSKEFMDSIDMAGLMKTIAAEPGQGSLWPQEEFDTKIAPLLETVLRKRGILK